MSYTVDFQSGGLETSPTIPGKTTINLAQGVVDSTSTTLSLTGKGVANYGEIQQENFIHLLENFASKNQPTHPTVGQLWYDTTSASLKVYSLDTTWKPVGLTASTSAPASPVEGQVWYDTSTDVLMVYNGSSFAPVGNTVVSAATQTELDKKLNLTGGTMTGALILNAAPSAALGAATKGYVDAANTTGNAATATKLASATTINGVSFDGSAPITVADSTKVPLAGGTMTGALILNAAPSAALGAATKGYVDSANTTGNAATATKLATATTINGVSFDGSAPITVADSTKVPLAGGTMTGALILNADPSTSLGAATKGYVDSANTTGNAATATKLATATTINGVSFDGSAPITVADSTKVPLAGGTMTGALILNADPSTSLGAATKGYVDAAANTKLNLSGGTLTGALILNAAPSTALGAATKGYVDSTLDARIPPPTLIENGYVNLGGFIIQWGMLPEQSTIGWYTVNFPIVFPTICTGVFSSYADGVNISGDYRGTGLIDNGSALVPMDGSNTYWMALGY